jgi:hypothetical protein
MPELFNSRLQKLIETSAKVKTPSQIRRPSRTEHAKLKNLVRKTTLKPVCSK